MKRIMLAAAALCALSATPANASNYHQYRCSNSTMLRVVFNEERGTATVVPYGRPSIRLQRAEGDANNFRYARRSYQLSGNLEEVQWRAGRAEWTCRASGG